MVSKGDLLLALYGATSGDIAISRMSGAINQAILCIRTTQDHLFLKSVWEKHVKNILNTYLQGGQGNLSADIVKNLFFYFPRIEEQRKIGRLIELIDQRIAIQNRIIEKYESLIKAIRLRVFSEILSEYECKQAIIADVLQYEQPAKYIVNSTEYLNDSSLTPVLTANKAFILGYTDETSGIYKKGECIILDDFTLDCKMVDFPFKVKSSAIKILTPRAGMNLRYIYEYLNYLELETTEHKRHYITEIEPMTIAIPEPNIIERIADVFNLLNGRLSCSKELLQTFLLLKRHILHQMFI